ncbi:MAG: hypothetical protein IJA11_08595 [Oscillospiraceae bacterium]|nr:hypothetical protein [Oscillospiraceae bacterium]
MTVAYYTNDEGVILRHHKVSDDMNPLELQEKIAEYNKKSRDKAHVHQIQEGSLEAYLFDLANKKLRLNKETVQDALDALSEARNHIECLMEEL